RPSHRRSSRIASAKASDERSSSVSSMRSRNVPPSFCAQSQLSRATRAFPTCNRPVGLGAKRNLVIFLSSRPFEAVRNRIATVPAEGARGDLDARRRLSPFVLGRFQKSPHALNHRLVMASSNEALKPHLFFNQALEDRVQLLVGGEAVLVLLVGPKFG